MLILQASTLAVVSGKQIAHNCFMAHDKGLVADGGRRIRLVYLSNSRIPSNSANSLQVIKMCHAFALRGAQVTVVGSNTSGSPTDLYSFYGVSPDLTVVRVRRPRLRGGGLYYGLRVRSLLRKQPTFDIAYGRCPYSLAAVATSGILLGYEVHTPPRYARSMAIQRYIMKRNNFGVLVTISQTLKKRYLRLYPWLEGKRILVLPDGADAFNSCVSELQLPGNWQGREGHLQVGYVGALYRGKGMEIISALAMRMPEVDFHVVGGSREDVDHWIRMCYSPNIHFYGFVEPGMVRSYLVRFDIVLAPYQRQVGSPRNDIAPWMSPLKIFEYMAVGCPIISSDLPVLREILVDGVNSLLVPPDSLEDWMNAIRLMEKEPELRVVLGTQARSDLEEHYTWERRAECLLKALL